MVNIYCFHGCGQNTDIFKSLLSSLQKKLKNHNWVYICGKYYKDDGGWGWYKECKESRKKDVIELSTVIKDPENSILIGFSEGGQMVLDLAQYIINIKGVVSISPSYAENICIMINCPVILITSQNDDKVKKKYSDKWKKYIKNVIDINHKKGHKVYLPLETRKIITQKLF